MQSKFRYEVILYWSDADQAFIAEVPELPGCAADGPTYHEALANVETVIEEWIETAKELGRSIPKRVGDCCSHSDLAGPGGEKNAPRGGVRGCSPAETGLSRALRGQSSLALTFGQFSRPRTGPSGR